MKTKIVILIILAVSALVFADDNLLDNPELKAEKVKSMFNEYFGADTETAFVLEPAQKFQWSDIPELLKLAQDDTIIDKMPSLAISSYIGRRTVKGIVALWFIEGLREKQNEITLQKQLLRDVTANSNYRLPLNAFCTKKGLSTEDCQGDKEIHKEVLKAYQQWWQMVKDLEPHQAACFDPLAISDCQWFGSRRFHRKTDLYYIDALCTFFEMDLEARIMKQTVYAPTGSTTSKSSDPGFADLYEPYKCILFYYSEDNTVQKTEEIILEKDLSVLHNEGLRRQLLNLKQKSK